MHACIYVCGRACARTCAQARVYERVCVYGVPRVYVEGEEAELLPSLLPPPQSLCDLTVSARVGPAALSAGKARLLFRGLVMSS